MVHNLYIIHSIYSVHHLDNRETYDHKQDSMLQDIHGHQQKKALSVWLLLIPLHVPLLEALMALLLILCSGALAFITLFNLTNINIMERVREIATVKVLGFYPGETAATCCAITRISI